MLQATVEILPVLPLTSQGGGEGKTLLFLSNKEPLEA